MRFLFSICLLFSIYNLKLEGQNAIQTFSNVNLLIIESVEALNRNSEIKSIIKDIGFDYKVSIEKISSKEFRVSLARGRNILDSKIYNLTNSGDLATEFFSKEGRGTEYCFQLIKDSYVEEICFFVVMAGEPDSLLEPISYSRVTTDYQYTVLINQNENSILDYGSLIANLDTLFFIKELSFEPVLMDDYFSVNDNVVWLSFFKNYSLKINLIKNLNPVILEIASILDCKRSVVNFVQLGKSKSQIIKSKIVLRFLNRHLRYFRLINSARFSEN